MELGVLWRENEKSRIRAVQIKELCGVKKGLDERIDETFPVVWTYTKNGE